VFGKGKEYNQASFLFLSVISRINKEQNIGQAKEKLIRSSFVLLSALKLSDCWSCGDILRELGISVHNLSVASFSVFYFQSSSLQK